MKTDFTAQGRNGVLVLALLLIVNLTTFAQASAPVIAEVRLLKVEPQNSAEFEKLIKEVFKPVAQMRKQNGQITGWQFYKIDFAGTDDPYQYATVHVYNAWEKTEPKQSLADQVKTALPKADANAIMTKALGLAKIVRIGLYERVDGVALKPDVRTKYVFMNFMKVKEGMDDAYLDSETKDWKPVFQEMSDTGKRAGWGLWVTAYPGGTAKTHDYVTTDIYTSYSQIFESMTDAFKKVHANQDITLFFQKAGKTRDLVRSELWELLDAVN